MTMYNIVRQLISGDFLKNTGTVKKRLLEVKKKGSSCRNSEDQDLYLCANIMNNHEYYSTRFAQWLRFFLSKPSRFWPVGSW